jgi:hypothetical protein
MSKKPQILELKEGAISLTLANNLFMIVINLIIYCGGVYNEETR